VHTASKEQARQPDKTSEQARKKNTTSREKEEEKTRNKIVIEQFKAKAKESSQTALPSPLPSRLFPFLSFGLPSHLPLLIDA